MKLLADVNIAAATIRALRDRGYDVLALPRPISIAFKIPTSWPSLAEKADRW